MTDEIEKNYFHICSQLACEVLNKILSKKKKCYETAGLQQNSNKTHSNIYFIIYPLLAG